MQPAKDAAAGGLGPTLSIVIPLLAAFIGATAGGLARYWLDRRAERAEFRAAVWVIGDDLSRLQAHLKARPMTALGIPGHPRAEGAAWSALDKWLPADRRVLARGLHADPATWGRVRQVTVLVSEYHGLLAKRQAGVLEAQGDSQRAIFLDEELTTAVGDALAGLAPHLGRSLERRFRRQQKRLTKPSPTDA